MLFQKCIADFACTLQKWLIRKLHKGGQEQHQLIGVLSVHKYSYDYIKADSLSYEARSIVANWITPGIIIISDGFSFLDGRAGVENNHWLLVDQCPDGLKVGFLPTPVFYSVDEASDIGVLRRNDK